MRSSVRGSWVVVVLLTCLGFSARASAQAASAPDREALLARTDAELSSEPVVVDPAAIAFELEVLDAQRDTVDIGGTTALQWTSAVLMILGAVTMAVLGLGAAFVAAGGNSDDAGRLVAAGGITLACTLALGGIGLGLAELDGNLHHRRAIDGRIRTLRRARRAAGYALDVATATLRF
jgi:hypothetical protein